MTDRIRRTEKTTTFEITISGLLNKRSDLVAEAGKVQAQLASLRDDMAAIDRILGVLAYAADPAETMPSPKRLQTPFRHGELGRIIFDTLRTSPEPMTTRQIAQATFAKRGEDESDKALFQNRLQCVVKALRYFERQGALTATPAAGRTFAWALPDALKRQ